MSRIDRKYWFHISVLNELLESILPFYDILEINGKRLLEYKSAYFDTEDAYMYIKHHNRKLNRYKVRRRTYLTTNECFFEIKRKTNKKRTIKKRIPTEKLWGPSTKQEEQFLSELSPFDLKGLSNSMNNHFYRMTLIHKEKLDRCTVDVHPRFWNDNGEVELKNLVIFELKRGKSLKGSPIVSMLRKLKVRQRGLSKYCTGRALLEPGLKKNTFKPRLRYIYKNILN